MQRFTPSRKAAILYALDEGHISAAEALDVYALSPEEAESWRKAIDARGISGLKMRNMLRR